MSAQQAFPANKILIFSECYPIQDIWLQLLLLLLIKFALTEEVDKLEDKIKDLENKIIDLETDNGSLETDNKVKNIYVEINISNCHQH